jgi:hypothetical protein
MKYENPVIQIYPYSTSSLIQHNDKCEATCRDGGQCSSNGAYEVDE